MSEKRLESSSRIEQGDWGAFLNTFSTENRGRAVSVEIVGMDIGDQPLDSGAKLDAIAYDPAGKGNAVVISVDAGTHHPIHGVTEVWAARTTTGEIVALEFVDQDGRRTILRM